MKKLFRSASAAHLLGAALLLTVAAGCKKKDEVAPTPSNTTLLTGPTWRSTDVRLTINGVEGIYTPSPANDTKFAADGKYTTTPVGGGSASTGTWSLLSNETQLQQTSSTSSGSYTTDPYQIYTLSSTDLVVGYAYTQAQVQHAIDNNNTSPTTTDRTILSLIFAASAFKFPNNTPPVSSAAQITSLGFRGSFKAQ